jgi:plastocyanin
MPPWQYIVASVIASAVVVGCGGSDGSAAAGPASDGPVTATTIVGLDTMKFNPETIKVKAGTQLKITFRNAGIIAHDLVTEGGTQNAKLVNVGSSKSQEGTFLANKPGEYKILCTQPGHVEAGMVGKIVVE